MNLLSVSRTLTHYDCECCGTMCDVDITVYFNEEHVITLTHDDHFGNGDNIQELGQALPEVFMAMGGNLITVEESVNSPTFDPLHAIRTGLLDLNPVKGRTSFNDLLQHVTVYMYEGTYDAPSYLDYQHHCALVVVINGNTILIEDNTLNKEWRGREWEYLFSKVFNTFFELNVIEDVIDHTYYYDDDYYENEDYDPPSDDLDPKD